MSVSGREHRSRGELIRMRARTQFVGRRAQLSLFAENLDRDPESEGDPAEFLFHVRGVGGVGKSTLLRQWREIARRAGAVAAVVDENDVHDVPQALGELARQLAEEAGPLKGFDRAAEQYRREQGAPADPASAEGSGVVEGGASLSSRAVTQAAMSAASLIPGASVVTAMANPEAAAQGLDRLRASAGARGRRGHGADGVSRAFVTELGRLCRQYPWVVVFFDTWEQSGRYLDGWLRELLADAFGPLPANVMVVLAGRDELAEREWAPLRAQVADVPLEMFTEMETRALLAARGVTEPDAVEGVLHLSMGLPLLVELFALARTAAAGEVDVGSDAMDVAVERFVRWITDPQKRDAVLACALAPQLNEDVFAAAVPQEAHGLWEWLCGQPFVSGHGDFKQYHAVVRASMVRRQRTHSPQRWATAHLHLADIHALWRTDAEQDLSETKQWGDPRWRRHRLDETYHRLCAHPTTALNAALEQAVQAAGQDAAVLRQWTDILEQAARDSADPDLLSWADRLQNTAADSDPILASLTALLTHNRLSPATRAWAHTYRGRRLYLIDRDEEGLAELGRAILTDPRNSRAWAYRGDLHCWHNRTDEAVADLTTALDLDTAYAWALARRGEAHRRAGRYDEAVSDLTASLVLDPTYAWALTRRGEAHRQSGHYDQAITDLTAALDLDPTSAWVLTQRGEVHRGAGHYDLAVTDFTAALDHNPTYAWALTQRGEAHRQSGHYDQAITDLTAALDLDPTDAYALTQRGVTHQGAGHYDLAVTDFTAALDHNPTYTWALTQRGEAHRQSGHYDQAITDLTAALDLDPTDAYALTQRGVTHQGAGHYDLAIADFTAALDHNPTYAWALTQRGEAHRQSGHYDQAITDLTAALDHNPTYAWTLTHRGVTHRQSGHYDQAITDLTAALDLDPTDTWALTQRGEAHRQSGHYDQAITDFTAALDHNPTYAWTLTHRGVTHRQSGHYDQAITDLTAALDLDPTDTWALTQRGEAYRQSGHYDQAITDFTAALDHNPTDTWTLTQRGVTHREAGRYLSARDDLEHAAVSDSGDPGLLLELLLLDTLTAGLTVCADRWNELLTSSVETPKENGTRFFGLLRMLLLDPDSDPVQTAEMFLSESPNSDAVTDLLHYLAELALVGGDLADRSRRCRRLVAEHFPG